MIEVDQGGHTAKLKVMGFTDLVCLTDSYDFCVEDFKFYPIYEQRGLYEHEDGILGIAPV